MKVTLPASTLAAALNQAVEVVERRLIIPILTHALLRVEGDRLTICCTDMDSQITVKMPADVAETGSLAIDARELRSFVKSLNGPVTIYGRDGEDIIIESASSGASRRLPSRLVDEFPMFRDHDFSHTVTLPGPQLHSTFNAVRFAISTDEIRYYMNGVYMGLHERAGRPVLHAVTTDGHRLTRIEHPLPAGAQGMPGIIIPRNLALLLCKLLQKCAENVEMGISDKQISLNFPGPGGSFVTIRSKLVDGTFPEYTRVIPDPRRFGASSFAATLPRAELAKTLKTFIRPGRGNGKAVRLNFTGTTLEISQKSFELGETKATIPLPEKSDRFDIGFDPSYLRDICEQFSGPTLSMKGADCTTAILFDDGHPNEHLAVLMPKRW